MGMGEGTWRIHLIQHQRGPWWDLSIKWKTWVQFSMIQAVNGRKNYKKLWYINPCYPSRERKMMAARKGCRVREECFILNKNEALYYSLTSIKTISSPYKSNWISSVKFSKEIFLLCFFDQKKECTLPTEFGKLHTKIWIIQLFIKNCPPIKEFV